MKIMLDIGHYKCDSGAIYNGVKEVDLNVDIAKYCEEELKRHKIETKVSYGTLDNRINMEKAYKPDYFVSIHNNAGKGAGTEVFVLAKGGKAEKLASSVYEYIVNVDKLNNGRGIKTANYYVLKNTNAPAILIECAFIDSNNYKCIDTLEERKAMGISIAKGILKHIGVKYVPKETNETLYRVCVGSFKEKNNALKLSEELKKKGYNSFIITEKKNAN